MSNTSKDVMITESRGDTLRLSGFGELNAGNATAFRDEARAALTDRQTCIEVDLSQTRFVDSSGLGALISLYKTMCTRSGKIRLVNPTEPVNQLLELTRMHRLFEIARF